MTRATVATLTTAATALSALAGTAGAAAPLGVVTTAPRDVTAVSATLTATTSQPDALGVVLWQYGTTTNYGSTTLGVTAPLIGTNQLLTLGVTGLLPATTYHVRAVATNALATAYGRDLTFVTAALGGTPRGEDDDDQGEDDNSGSGSGSSGSGSGSGSSGSGSNSNSGSSGSGSSGSGSGPATPSPAAGDDHRGTGGGTDDAARSGSNGTGAGAENGKGRPVDDGSGAKTAPGLATAALTPALGRSVGLATVRGTVVATSPSGAPVDLADARLVPTGTIIDTRAGAVELKSSLGADGATQVGRFWGGRFEVRQDPSDDGLTQLVLRGGSFADCPAPARGTIARSAASKARKPPRSLWGSDDHGRFQTRGRGSVATVRGTRWLTQDRCDGTLTRVTSGAVAVRDLRRQRTVVVRQGHSYLARTAR